MAKISIYRKNNNGSRGKYVKTIKNARYKTLGKKVFIYDLSTNKEKGSYSTEDYTWTSTSEK